jgi:hypothetical protein
MTPRIAIAIVASLGLIAEIARTASASTRPPVVYNGYDGWRSNGTPPHRLRLDPSSAEAITNIHWGRLNREGFLYATGRIVSTIAGVHTYFNVSFSFDYGATGGGVSTHDGVKYYTQMSVKFFGGGESEYVWNGRYWHYIFGF